MLIYSHHFAAGFWIRWISPGTRARLLRWRRHQPDHSDRDHSVALESHLTICRYGHGGVLQVDAAWGESPIKSAGRTGGLSIANGDFPRIAAWGPPPRNQINHLQKITVWANNTGFCCAWVYSVVTTS